MYDAESKLQVALGAVHAVAFLGLAVWCLRRTSEGRWAVLGVAGAGLLGLSFGITAASWVEIVFLERHWIAMELLREHVYTVLNLGQAAGAVLLVATFVQRRATTRASGDPLYGP